LTKIILKRKRKGIKKIEKKVNFEKNNMLKKKEQKLFLKKTMCSSRDLELLIMLCSNLDHPFVYYSGFIFFSIKVCLVTCYV
jgi:hypothetical protein